jgi:hypothetical protein
METPKISFILPTIRPYNDWAKHVVDSIFEAPRSFDIEVLISSKEKIKDPRITWIPEPEALGSVKSVNNLYKNTKGKYIHAACDDMIYQRQWPEVIKELEYLEWRSDKFIALAGFCNQTCYLAAWHSPHFIKSRVNPRYISARFPIISRDTIDKYFGGLIFNESFKHHYVDNWMGHWCGENGCSIPESEFLKVNVLRHCSNGSYDQYDEDIFMKICDKLKENPSTEYNVIIT